MTKDDDTPEEETERESDDEAESTLMDLRAVKLVLEVTVLLARLLRVL
ncbi:hypothetical protein [Halorientalis sp. IM1011]|nr:hypothetical protein [Halorientalis sp. IM1011]